MGSDRREMERLHIGWFIFAFLVPSEISAHWITLLTLGAGLSPPVTVLHADLCGEVLIHTQNALLIWSSLSPNQVYG